ncbi:MAG TPA: glycosyltransferase family 9 protein [Thermodesulfovibrio thiophilus]|uniref:glycosyltransferase family 9 protein n=1 Tax=Thermodesulfovibrio thiophilus TaxID=340095 RepID=UPI0017B8E045|nr:glycosyltransferase family 9 protein [Thermodesulfovibrio thiophilus]HHW20201.1 glycosyltransferase family 9 protein [Thermodesulfovibrio thiophilus]HOA83030.1 glycosyltransferase family 9 protein [Thermodesulfovibrio thiophilus]HQA03470.1 glycosyltransferase family 9 protein [Thermodesulfovibrio thiophilus]HQD36105.1 glycosyltransferase family 9 protein [Thermodesulfovibrio thiophilus]
MKALVYRMGGLGDSLLVYPVLEILTRKGYEVTVWGNPEYFQLAEKSGFCKKSIFYEPADQFDRIIVFSKNRELLHNHKTIYVEPLPDKRIWIVKYYLKKLNFERESFSKKLKLPFSIEKSDKLCIIHPSSGSQKKNPEPNFFLQLEKFIENCGYKVLYISGPAEKYFNKALFKNSIYLEDITELTKTLLQASLYIGVDSGVSHLSSYLGISSIIIFGPTDPVVWHPIGKNVTVIRDENCQPCFPNICTDRQCLRKEKLIEKIKDLFRS